MIIGNSRIPDGKKLFMIRLAWWVLFLIFTVFTAFSIWTSQIAIGMQTIPDVIVNIIIAIDIAVKLISWLLAITIFLKKSNEWITVFVSMMFFSTASSFPFLIWVLEDGWGKFPQIMSLYPTMTAKLIGLPFDVFATVISIVVFLTFPTGQWISPRAKQLLYTYIVFSVVITIITISVEPDPRVFNLPSATSPVDEVMRIVSGVLGSLFRLAAGYMLFMHYRDMQNSVHRQQMKWIVVIFIASVCASTVIALIYIPVNILGMRNDPASAFQHFRFYVNLDPWLSLPSSILNLGLVIAFSVAIFRYRLWDIDVLINKALVYSSLTALLGGLFLVSTALVSYVITKWFGEADSSAWAAAISALPVATSFNPLRERLQAFVDQYFKPEEVNFSDTFVEFQPEIQKLLTHPRIIQILSEQVKKQLNVDFARVYLLEQDNQLHYAEPTPISEENHRLVLEDKHLTKLKDGKIVVDDDGVPYSLLVPLLVPRARIPDFLGVIVLGRRMENKGYSTPILKNLQALGADAGKAIYLSQIREQAIIQHTG